MQQIKDLINKILWDKSENKEDYSFFYIDRITKREMEIKGSDIKRIEGSFIVVEKGPEETEIPVHRIIEVKKAGKIVLSRVKKEKTI